MKWHKYLDLRQSCAVVDQVTTWFQPGIYSNTEAGLKGFVRKTLEYIAIRPQKSLNLQWMPEVSFSGPIPGFYETQRIWHDVRYHIFFNVGRERLCRIHRVSEEKTIAQEFAELDEWYQRVKAAIGELSAVYVARYTNDGGVYGIRRAHLELYRLDRPTFAVTQTAAQQERAELLDIAREIVDHNLQEAGITREAFESGNYPYSCGCLAEDGCSCDR